MSRYTASRPRPCSSPARGEMGEGEEGIRPVAGNSFGELFRITTWGESHGRAIGVVIDGCPAAVELSEEDIQRDLNRRRVGQSQVTSSRQEEDRVGSSRVCFKEGPSAVPSRCSFGIRMLTPANMNRSRTSFDRAMRILPMR